MRQNWSYWDLWQATPFMTTKQMTTYAANCGLQAYWTRQTDTDGTGSHTCKECHKTESLWNHNTTDRKEGEQLEDRRSVGASSCNCGDGTDQRVQSLMFMMMMMMMMMIMMMTTNSSNMRIEYLITAWSLCNSTTQDTRSCSEIILGKKFFFILFCFEISEIFCRLYIFNIHPLTLWRLTTHIVVVSHR